MAPGLRAPPRCCRCRHAGPGWATLGAAVSLVAQRAPLQKAPAQAEGQIHSEADMHAQVSVHLRSVCTAAWQTQHGPLCARALGGRSAPVTSLRKLSSRNTSFAFRKDRPSANAASYGYQAQMWGMIRLAAKKAPLAQPPEQQGTRRQPKGGGGRGGGGSWGGQLCTRVPTGSAFSQWGSRARCAIRRAAAAPEELPPAACSCRER
jgi:hypothetical protein